MTNDSAKQRLFPSDTMAIVLGAVFFPLGVGVTQWLESEGTAVMVRAACVLVCFFIPMMFSTWDFPSWVRSAREAGGFFRAFRPPDFTAYEFRTLILPTWKRMLLWFISGSISLVIWHLLGVV